jgi:hypothetical protein
MKRIISIHEPSSWVRGKAFITSLVVRGIESQNEHFAYEKENWETIFFSACADNTFTCLGESNMYSTANQTYTFLYHYNQMYYAWYLSTMNHGKPLVLQIGDKDIHTMGKLHTGAISSFFLLRCISTAMVLRDKKALDYYATIPVEFTEKGRQDDLMYETMMFFYQVLLKGAPNPNEPEAAIMHIEKLYDWEEYLSTVYQEGYNTSDIWRILFDTRKPLFEHIHVPVLRIYHAILHKDQAQYEDSVFTALQQWKAYFSIGEYELHGQEYDNSTQGEGFLALPIIAACAYAYDQGMKLETVESDYIPSG